MKAIRDLIYLDLGFGVTGLVGVLLVVVVVFGFAAFFFLHPHPII